MAVRRKEREVADEKKMDEIIRSCECCRIGLYDNGEVYIVPLNFGYQREDGTPVFYFHGAQEGRKMHLIAENPRVGFELDTNGSYVKGEDACSYSYCYQSVIGTGKITILKDLKEKAYGLNQIMKRISKRADWDFPVKALEKVCVYRMEAEKMSGKEHRRR